MLIATVRSRDWWGTTRRATTKMQGSIPDPIDGIDLAGGEPDPSESASITGFSEQEQPPGLSLADAEEPTSEGVVHEESETTKFSVTACLKQAWVNVQYSEHARRTSWVGPFVLVVAIAAVVTLAFIRWV